MTPRRPVRILLALPLLALGAACGDDGEALSAGDYRREANEICRAGNDRLEKEGEGLAKLFQSDEKPTDDEIRDALDPLLDGIEDQIEQIRALEGPDDLEGDVRGILEDADAALADLRSDLDDDPVAALESEEDPFAEVNEQLAAAGLEECADE